MFNANCGNFTWKNGSISTLARLISFHYSRNECNQRALIIFQTHQLLSLLPNKNINILQFINFPVPQSHPLSAEAPLSFK